ERLATAGTREDRVEPRPEEALAQAEQGRVALAGGERLPLGVHELGPGEPGQLERTPACRRGEAVLPGREQLRGARQHGGASLRRAEGGLCRLRHGDVAL